MINKPWREWIGMTSAAVLGSTLTAGIFIGTLKSSAIATATPLTPAQTTKQTSSTTSLLNGNTSAVQNLSATTNSSSTAATVSQVFKEAEPSVVAVVNYQYGSSAYGQTSSQLEEYGVGSGVFIRKDAQYAYIVTNNHVISGANKLEVVLSSGQHVTATLVGADPYSDLAVMRVPVSSFKNVNPVQFADSNQIQVGQLAIAIGTPGGLDFAETVTSGIVSGQQRMMPVASSDNSNEILDNQSVIQTDAAINPGNSGGPLLNSDGQVIGINSSKIVQTGFEGMGFAIPSNEVENIVGQILTTGHVEHPALGITGYSLSSVPEQDWPNVPVNYGMYVYSVDSTAAKNGGLKQGDVIVGLNGQTIQDESALRTALFAVKPGTTVSVEVYRGSEKLTLRVVVGSMTATQASTSSSSFAGGDTSGAWFGANGSSGNSSGYGSGSGSGSGNRYSNGYSNGYGTGGNGLS